MSDQNPFDQPPTNPTPPFNTSLNAPLSPPPGDWGPTTPFNPIGDRQGGPGRGKIAVVALAAAALTGGAIFGISQFADADDPVLGEANVANSIPAIATETQTVVGSEQVGNSANPVPSIPDVMRDFGDCLNIDLDELLGSLPSGGAGGAAPNADFSEIGDSVTVTDASGVTIYTLGDGDGSISISKAGGQVTVAVSGDVVESTSLDFGDFEAQMDDMMAELDNIDFENIDPESFDIDEFLESLDLEKLNIDITDMSVPAVSLPADFDHEAMAECFEQLDG